MKNWLRSSNDAKTRAEENYSVAIAGILAKAYTAEREGKSARVLALLAPCAGESMGMRQQLRVHLLTARARYEDDKYADACAELDRALDIANQLEDLVAPVDLHALYAHCEVGQRHFISAIRHNHLALANLSGPHAPRPIDRKLQLSLLIELMDFTFALARYAECAAYATRTERLALRPSRYPQELAIVSWVKALLYRWRQEPWKAFDLAKKAAAIIERLSEPQTRGRIRIVLADVALDIAEILLATDDLIRRRQFIELAGPWAAQAIELCHSAGDVTGEGQAQLALMRYSRMSGRNEDRVPVIEYVLRSGRREGDHGLVGQSLTAMGDELFDQGLVERAKQYYQRAIDALEASDFRALLVWPERALERISAMAGFQAIYIQTQPTA